MDIAHLRQGATVLIPVTYKGVHPSDLSIAVLWLPSGARAEVPIDQLRGIVNQPMRPGDAVRWDHGEEGHYWTGRLVDFLASDDSRAVVDAMDKGEIVIDAVATHLRLNDVCNPTGVSA